MPIFEYRCEHHHTFEEFKKYENSGQNALCPVCGGEAARTVNAPALHFMGVGWARDGYANRAEVDSVREKLVSGQ